MKKLLLFDVDGTLVDTEGAGLSSLQSGIYKAFPEKKSTPFPSLDLGGATDGSVVSFLFGHFQLKVSRENEEVFFQCYLSALTETLNSFQAEGKGRCLAGVIPLLDALAKEPDRWSLALLTGNIAAGAKAKLQHYGLAHYFSFGAYGDDHSDRNALGPIALKRAAVDYGLEFAPEDTLIIGDTPKDIACARAFGAKVLAVATGASSPEALKAANPDRYLKDFADTTKSLAAIEELLL